MPLTDLQFNKGTLSPNFTTNVDNYVLYIDGSGLTLTPTFSGTLTVIQDSSTLTPIDNVYSVNGVNMGDSSTITITVSENSVDTVYTITVSRADTRLTALTNTSGYGLSPSFASGTLSYTLNIDMTDSLPSFTPTKSEATATLAVTQGATTITENSGDYLLTQSISQGSSSTVSIIVSHLGFSQTYTIAVSRADTRLTALTNTSGYSISPAFASGTLSYTLNIDMTDSLPSFTPTKSEATATLAVTQGATTITVNAGAYLLTQTISQGSSSTVSIIVSHLGFSQTYTIAVSRADTRLTALTNTSGYSISPAFASGTLSYTLNIDMTDSLPSFTPTKSEATATLAVTQGATTITVNAGAYLLTQTISQGSSSTVSIIVSHLGFSQTYTITVSRADTRLTALTNTGGRSMSPSFATGTLSYTLDIDMTDSLPSFTPTKSEATATLAVTQGATTITVNAGAYLLTQTISQGSSSTVSIIVSHLGFSQTYTIAVSRADTRLTALTNTSGYSISPAFASGTLSYTLNIDMTDSLPSFTPTKSEATATLDVTQGATTITVNAGAYLLTQTISQGNSSTVSIVVSHLGFSQTYTITVSRADTRLSALTNTGGRSMSPSFAMGTLSYTLKIHMDDSLPSITPTKNNNSASLLVKQDAVTITDNSGYQLSTITRGSTSQVTITVSHLGFTSVYTVSVTRVDSTLSSVTPTPRNLLSNFSSTTYSYSLNVNQDDSLPSFTLSTTSNTATLTVTQDSTSISKVSNQYTLTETINVGSSSTVTITVTNETFSKSYTITVNRVDTTLSSLTSDVRPLVETFSSALKSYTVNLDNLDALPGFTLSLTDSTNSSVTVNQDSTGLTISSGKYTFVNSIALKASSSLNITVSQPGCSTTYTVTVNRIDTNLSALTTNVGYLATAFSPTTYTYDLIIFSTSNLPTLTLTSSDVLSTLSVTQDNSSPSSSITFTLPNSISQDSSSTVSIRVSRLNYYKDYTLTVRRTIERTVNTSKQLTYHSSTQTIDANSDKYNLLSLSVNVEDIFFSKPTGVAYGVLTGYSGVVTKFSVTALDKQNATVTSFTETPVNLILTLPNADISKTFQIFKVDPNTGIKVSPQPSGLPKNVVYDSNSQRFSVSINSLSTFIVQDTTPPSGTLGGDPHLVNIKGEVVLIPNSWKYFRFYEDETQMVCIKCEHLHNDIIENMHKYIDGQTAKVELWRDRYVRKYTYMVELDIINKPSLEVVCKIDMITGTIIFNKSITVDKIISEGLYSISNKFMYECRNNISYGIYLASGSILNLTIDNFWDDLNNLTVTLGSGVSTVKGELFEHSEENNLS
jgi:hypothetical protein